MIRNNCIHCKLLSSRFGKLLSMFVLAPIGIKPSAGSALTEKFYTIYFKVDSAINISIFGSTFPLIIWWGDLKLKSVYKNGIGYQGYEEPFWTAMVSTHFFWNILVSAPSLHMENRNITIITKENDNNTYNNNADDNNNNNDNNNSNSNCNANNNIELTFRVTQYLGDRDVGHVHCSFERNLSSWWRHQMETFSTLLAICAGNTPAIGEFPWQRPVTRSFDVFFDCALNKRLSKQSWGWWFETKSRSLWRHFNEYLDSSKLKSLKITDSQRK